MRRSFLFLLCLLIPLLAKGQDTPDYPVDPALFSAMEWRNVGPYRGGRATAAVGVPSEPMTFYMGATGGGVWKTTDGGVSWQNISDGFFNTATVGAIAVAESDPNVVYVGMGESPVRGVTTSHGDGVYKSTDAGKTWTHLGLEKTRQISGVAVHPQNPDLVYVAAQGMSWAPNPERGIYRSNDGGQTWELVLHVDERTGASDLSMDFTNPRILYAAFWEHQRLPWQVISGGPGSGLYKSTDGGDTWELINTGLPDLMGKIGVSVSRANPERVWALIEAEGGGLFRSDNGGKAWTRINRDRVLRARSWYYMHVFADPVDEETVYVMNAPMLRSVDGGATFKPVSTPHGDNHHLWVNPNNNDIMINANDGGANVSFNGGKTWSTQTNQPTAQFYRVITDNRFPYYIYGGQQDNSTVAIASQTSDASIGREDWYPVGGCESAHVAFDPDNPMLVYAGCYQGIISEYDHSIQQSRSVMAYPFLGLGSDAIDQKYRFNWNAPIVVSPHAVNVIYHAGNVLLKSEDRGVSWTEISPDLTRNEVEKQGKGGAPITNEAAGAEVYNTIFYVVESIHEAGTIWAGTDDGLVHITRDGGSTWNNITPQGIGETQINTIDVSPHNPAKAYLAVTAYKLGDYTPHVFKTEDYGHSWERLVEGITEEAFVRVVREDPEREGLLYAGTEAGLYISFDDGEQWQPFKLNLPVVPITDLTIRHNDLIAATQGRAFWVLDDLSPLHQISDEVANADVHLFKPSTGLLTFGSSPTRPNEGKNPPNGALLYYHLASVPDTGKVDLKLDILDAAGDVLRTVTYEKPKPGATPSPNALTAKAGMNRFVWNFRLDNVTVVPGLFTFGSLAGYRVAPGEYTVRLTYGETVTEQSFTVELDPRVGASETDLAEQQTLLASLYANANAIHDGVIQARTVRDQVNALMGLTAEHAEADTIKAAGQALVETINTWESHVVQPKQETFQDVINFPNKLNAHILNLMSNIDAGGVPVIAGAKARFNDLQTEWQEHEATLQQILNEDVPAFNTLVRDQAIPAVVLPAKASDE